METAPGRFFPLTHADTDGSNSTMCEGIFCPGGKLSRYCR